MATAHADDAGVYRLSDECALVATVDFFTPVVDDPYLYGEIAAANALSDVYAMGGDPLYALSVACFPDDERILPLLPDVLAGAASKAGEAGIEIIGGHTLRDKEPKFGLAVTGRVHPKRIWRNDGAKAGDLIVLTKPLGTGIVSTGIKWGICPKGVEAAAFDSMARLNAAASRAGRTAGISTATDVTGFGLLGHLLEVVLASGLSAKLLIDDVPVLPGARDLMTRKIIPSLRKVPLPFLHSTFGFRPIPGGVREALEFHRSMVSLSDEVAEDDMLLLADPQTSGGLLLFVAEERADALRDSLESEGVEAAWIGSVGPYSEGGPRVNVE